MHLVLVNPGSPLRRTGGLLARFVEPIPPLGLTGLAAFVRPHGHTVTVLDQYATGEDADALTARILAERPGLVGFSCLTPNMGEVLDVVARLRAQAPDLPVVFGNTHAAVFHDRILAKHEADYCVRGEGEEPLLALLEALEGRRALSSVPNLGYRDADGQVVRTPDQKPTVPLDDLPFPDWSRIDLGAYVNHPMIAMHGPTLPIQGSRGCAYACTFCAQDQVFTTVRRRSHASICDEIEHDIATYGVTQFGFIDAYWPLSVKQGHAFLDELERRGLHRRITWVTETRVDKVDEGLLRRMAADGCRLIMYGVEFGDDEMLAATQKRTKSSQTRDAIRWTHEAGILTLGLYIIGMPGQDVEGIRRTFAFARELGTDIAKFNIAVPLPGSKFFEEIFGDQVDDLPYEAFSSWYDPTASGRALAWTPEGLDGVELVRLQRYGMLRYYLRPGFVMQTLRRRSIRPRDMANGAFALVGDAARIALARQSSRGSA